MPTNRDKVVEFSLRCLAAGCDQAAVIRQAFDSGVLEGLHDMCDRMQEVVRGKEVQEEQHEALPTDGLI